LIHAFGAHPFGAHPFGAHFVRPKSRRDFVEPAVRYKRTLAFQASALSRSATSPD